MPPAQHSFKLIVIAIEPVNVVKMVREQVESIKEISIYLKVSTKIGHSVVQFFY